MVCARVAYIVRRILPSGNHELQLHRIELEIISEALVFVLGDVCIIIGCILKTPKEYVVGDYSWLRSNLKPIGSAHHDILNGYVLSSQSMLTQVTR